jgi:hypothetical protein
MPLMGWGSTSMTVPLSVRLCGIFREYHAPRRGWQQAS